MINFYFIFNYMNTQKALDLRDFLKANMSCGFP